MRFKITKKNWMRIHTYLSLFFLPACLIYVITGVGFIFDFKADAGANIYEFTISEIPPSRDAYNGRIKIQYHFIRANRYAILQEKPKSRAFDIYTWGNHHSNRGGS